MILSVKIIPNAKQNAFIECKDNILKIRVKGVPVKGKVNEELIHFLAETLDLPKNKITILSGFNQPRKRIKIEVLEDCLENFLKKIHFI